MWLANARTTRPTGHRQRGGRTGRPGRGRRPAPFGHQLHGGGRADRGDRRGRRPAKASPRHGPEALPACGAGSPHAVTTLVLCAGSVRIGDLRLRRRARGQRAPRGADRPRRARGARLGSHRSGGGGTLPGALRPGHGRGGGRPPGPSPLRRLGRRISTPVPRGVREGARSRRWDRGGARPDHHADLRGIERHPRQHPVSPRPDRSSSSIRRPDVQRHRGRQGEAGP